MAIDPARFAQECVRQGLYFKISPHYLLGAAKLRSGISDANQDDQIGPFRLKQAEWDANCTNDEYELDYTPSDINSWRAQCAICGIIALHAFDKLVAKNSRNPSALELYLQQWSDAAGATLQADLQKALDDTAALLDPAAQEVLGAAAATAPSAITDVGQSGPAVGTGAAATGVGGGVKETQQNATRNLPISGQLHDILEFAGRKTGIDVEVYSGGQPSSGPNRTGTHRHDVGDGRMGAADLFMRDAKTNRILDSDNSADREKMAAFIEESAAAGAIGIGHAPGYMGTTRTHIGGGQPEAVWGAGNSRSGAPQWVIQAFERGRARPLTSAQVAQGLAQMRQATPSA